MKTHTKKKKEREERKKKLQFQIEIFSVPVPETPFALRRKKEFRPEAISTILYLLTTDFILFSFFFP